MYDASGLVLLGLSARGKLHLYPGTNCTMYPVMQCAVLAEARVPQLVNIVRLCTGCTTTCYSEQQDVLVQNPLAPSAAEYVFCAAGAEQQCSAPADQQRLVEHLRSCDISSKGAYTLQLV